MAKQKISASAVVADVRSGISDAELIQKYSVSAKGLAYIFQKLVENEALTAEEMTLRSQAPSEPVEPDRKTSPAPSIHSRGRPGGTNSENIQDDNDCAWQDYWENKGNQGLFAAYFHTVLRCLASPAKFFSKLSSDLSYWTPTLFGGVSAGVPLAFTAAGIYLQTSGASMFEWVSLPILAGFTSIFTVALASIGLFMWSALTHAFLVILRGAHGGFRTTFGVVSYSCAPELCGVVPVLGYVVGNVWGLYLKGIGLRETHGTSTARAFGAVLMSAAVIVTVSVLWALEYDSSTTSKRALRQEKATISTEYTGERLPTDVCSAVADFMNNVDARVTQLDSRQARLAIQSELGKLDGTLEGFKEHPNIKDVREKAAAFAGTRLQVKLLENRAASFDRIHQEEKTAKRLLAELKSMCSQ